MEFVITTSEQYPQDIKFEVLKDKVDNFLKYNKVGQDVDVSYNVRGSEFKGKYYVNLIAWKVMKVEGTTQPEPIGALAAARPNEDSDLPF